MMSEGRTGVQQGSRKKEPASPSAGMISPDDALRCIQHAFVRARMHAYTHTQSTFTCATDIHVYTDHTHTLTHHESGVRYLEKISPSAQASFEPPSNTSRDPAISSPDVLDELDAAWVLSQAHAVPDVFAKDKSKTSHKNRRRSSEHSDSPSAPAYVKTRVSSGTAFDASQVWTTPPTHTHTHTRIHIHTHGDIPFTGEVTKTRPSAGLATEKSAPSNGNLVRL